MSSSQVQKGVQLNFSIISCNPRIKAIECSLLDGGACNRLYQLNTDILLTQKAMLKASIAELSEALQSLPPHDHLVEDAL